mmetsp:Transcript_4676/g.13484  ORF Transcript_4676/g.13484 Transcript_4676/m.13484 type:complete len:249 (-) Transcript_4676:11-757(-)
MARAVCVAAATSNSRFCFSSSDANCRERPFCRTAARTTCSLFFKFSDAWHRARPSRDTAAVTTRSLLFISRDENRRAWPMLSTAIITIRSLFFTPTGAHRSSISASSDIAAIIPVSASLSIVREWNKKAIETVISAGMIVVPSGDPSRLIEISISISFVAKAWLWYRYYSMCDQHKLKEALQTPTNSCLLSRGINAIEGCSSIVGEGTDVRLRSVCPFAFVPGKILLGRVVDIRVQYNMFFVGPFGFR